MSLCGTFSFSLVTPMYLLRKPGCEEVVLPRILSAYPKSTSFFTQVIQVGVMLYGGRSQVVSRTLDSPGESRVDKTELQFKIPPAADASMPFYSDCLKQC